MDPSPPVPSSWLWVLKYNIELDRYGLFCDCRVIYNTIGPNDLNTVSRKKPQHAINMYVRYYANNLRHLQLFVYTRQKITIPTYAVCIVF